MKRTKRVLAVLFVAMLAAGAAACGSDSDPATESDTPAEGAAGSTLEGTSWELMNIASTEGWATSLPGDLEAPSLTFEDGRVDVFAGCNSGTGEVELTENTIEFGPVTLTRKACDEAANQTEEVVSDFLSGEVRYSLNADGNLILERNTYSLVFVPASA